MLAVISILYGALVAIGQDDIPRLIAYTSLSHFGFIVLGIFVLNSQGLSGATLYMFNHGLSTAALFLVTGFLISRRGSPLISDYGGVEKVAPVLAGLFLVAGLPPSSLPGLSPFVSEFLVLVGALQLPLGGRRLRGHRHRAGRDLHPADVPAHDDRPARAPASTTMRDLDRARGRRARAAAAG